MLKEATMLKRTLVALLILLAACTWAAALTMDPPTVPELPKEIDTIFRCGMKPEPGPCKALFDRYYYDGKANKCKAFFWGGCDGVVPFETMEECEKTCPSPQTLRIKELWSLKDSVYAQVSVEFPKAWKEPAFLVKVDGAEANVRYTSGGYSGDRQMKSLMFFPGRPGKKQVTVSATVEGKEFEAKASLDWKPSPVVALVDHIGDSELVLSKEKIALVLANVDQPKIFFNGSPVRPEEFGNNARLFTFQPEWTAGLNTLTAEGKGPDGSPVSKNFTFVYLADGNLKQGETVLLRYGYPGSRSGPFFNVSIKGDAVAGVNHREAGCYVLDADGWLIGQPSLVVELRAVKSGPATVHIFEKPHFRMAQELKKEIRINVAP